MADVRLRKGGSANTHTVYIGSTGPGGPGTALTLVFSYETCVAFLEAGVGWTVCDNVWGPITGKHLNQETPRDAERVSFDTFTKRLARALNRIEVSGG